MVLEAALDDLAEAAARYDIRTNGGLPGLGFRMAVMTIQWACDARRQHAACGPLEATREEVDGLGLFVVGVTCPVHGLILKPTDFDAL
jgi:hypothetical protein